jgi:hypothetical protein
MFALAQALGLQAVEQAREAAGVQVAHARQRRGRAGRVEQQAQQGLPLCVGQAQGLHAAVHLGAQQRGDAAQLEAEALLHLERNGQRRVRQRAQAVAGQGVFFIRRFHRAQQ